MFVSWVKTEHVKYLRCNFYEKNANSDFNPVALDQDVIVKINYLAYFNVNLNE